MSLIRVLPEVLVDSLLRSWVEIIGLVRLDSAMCNAPERTSLFAYISGNSFAIENHTSSAWHTHFDLLTMWIMKRQISVAELVVSTTFASWRTDRLDYLQRHGQRIRCVKIKGYVSGSDVFRDLCENSPNVTSCSSDNYLPRAAQAYIAVHWKQLTRMSFKVREIGDELISMGKNCQSLMEFVLTGTGELAMPVEFFQVCSPQLSRLQLEGVLLELAHFKAIASHCQLLKHLKLPSRTLMDDDSLLSLAAGCSDLGELKMAGGETVTDAAISAIACNGALTKLCMSGFDSISDVGMSVVAERCPLLFSLGIPTCRSLTDVTLTALGQRCHNLRELDISGTAITHVGLRAVAAGCPQLEVLVAFASNTIAPAIVDIAQRCPRLRRLIAPDTDLSFAAILALRKFCPLLVELLVAGGEIGNEEISALLCGCCALTRVYITDTLVTEQGLCVMLDHCRKLGVTVVYECVHPEGRFDVGFYPSQAQLLDV
jgi:hypothetical protein